MSSPNELKLRNEAYTIAAGLAKQIHAGADTDSLLAAYQQISVALRKLVVELAKKEIVATEGMTLPQFVNGLRILYSLDSNELGDPEWWETFSVHPFKYLMRCDNVRAFIIWQAMIKRGVNKVLPNDPT